MSHQYEFFLHNHCLVKSEHGIFNMHNDLNACCANEGKKGAGGVHVLTDLMQSQKN